MRNTVASVTFAALCALFPASASGAEIELIGPAYSGLQLIRIAGEIVEGDASKFTDTVAGIERAIVLLQGPGGLVHEALDIGAQINIRGFATTVADETECYSACALIWLAGNRRYTSEGATIGVHAAFYQGDDTSLNVSGSGNAEIGAYLTHVGLRVEAIRYITMAEPDQGFLYLTPSISRSLGIDVYENEGVDVTTPLEAPSAPTIAFWVGRLIGVETNCGVLLGTGGQAARSAQVLLEQGHEDFGGERFATLLTEAVDLVKAEIDEDGPLAWCMDNTTAALRRGYDIGIDGPAFGCDRAETPNEMAICGAPSLWVMDRALSVFYQAAKETWPAGKQANLRGDQVAWLEDRQACGFDVACTEQMYQRRMLELLR